MQLNTKIFGQIEVDDDRIIVMENGIIGFPDLKHFALMHDSDKPDSSMAWFVSIEEPAFALPVIDPLVVVPDYNPEVNDDLLSGCGNLLPNDTLVLVTITVPADITQMTVNLMAPIIINAAERKGCQVILEDSDLPIRFQVYDILKKKKEGR